MKHVSALVHRAGFASGWLRALALRRSRGVLGAVLLLASGVPVRCAPPPAYPLPRGELTQLAAASAGWGGAR